jgi:solute carrier family 35 protein F5
MLLTTPLVVTVGLSLTIPLSLVGEIIQYGQYSSILYWIGALVVFISFAFINHETKDDGVKIDATEGAEDRAVTERLD